VTDGDAIPIIESQPVTNKGPVTYHKWENIKINLMKIGGKIQI